MYLKNKDEVPVLTLTLLESCLFSFITFYLPNLIYHSTIKDSGRSIIESVDCLTYVYMVFGVFVAFFFFSKSSNLYTSKSHTRITSALLIKQFTFITLLTSIAYYFDLYPLYLFIGAYLGVCYLLALVTMNIRIYGDYEFLLNNLSSLRLSNGLC